MYVVVMDSLFTFAVVQWHDDGTRFVHSVYTSEAAAVATAAILNKPPAPGRARRRSRL